MMRNYPLLAGLLLICLNWSVASPRYELTVEEEVHPLVIKKKLMLVEARVNTREGLFLLDTGISQLTLNARLFGKGSRESPVKMTDITGTTRPYREQFIKAFAWGALRRKRFLAYVVQMERLEKVLGVELLGMIGYDVLKDIEVRVDYGARRITLHRLNPAGLPLGQEATPPDHRIPFRMRGHLPSIEVTIGDHPVLQLGLDSGSALNVLNTSWKERLRGQALARYKIRYNAALSSRQVDYLALSRIDIAEELSLIYSKVAFTDLRHLWEHSVAVDGLLGIDLFRLGKVAINYRRRRISLWVQDNVYAMKYRSLVAGP